MEALEPVEVFTRKKRGCRYVIYYSDWDVPGGYGYMGNGGDTLEEALIARAQLSRPGMDLYIMEGDLEHPDAKEVA